jgi:uncharacterized protein (UPF0332 family)
MIHEAEISALLDKARRSLISSSVLLKSGDYEAMIMPTVEDAQRITSEAAIFMEATGVYLKRTGYEIEC